MNIKDFFKLTLETIAIDVVILIIGIILLIYDQLLYSNLIVSEYLCRSVVFCLGLIFIIISSIHLLISLIVNKLKIKNYKILKGKRKK